MKKTLTVFGSPLWPECEPLRELLLKNDIEFEYVNITESIKNLKIFLAIRDKSSYFDDIKARGSVGIPTIVVGEGEEFIDGSLDIDLDSLK